VIGRWNVVDAYAEHPDQVDLSPYAYVGNNPVDKTDPDGNCPPCETDYSEGDITGNGGSIIENAIGAAKDAVTSGVFTLASFVNHVQYHTPMMEASFDYSSGERKMVMTPVNSTSGTAAATGNALLGISNVIPIDGPMAGVFAKAAGVRTSATTIIKDATKVEKEATDVVTHAGHKVDPITGQKIGPSGKPAVHTVNKASGKAAKDAARNDRANGGSGTSVKHTKDAKGGAHYHNGSGVEGKGKDSKDYGKKAGKISNNVHYQYPEG
jgi:hypothetical protein